MAGDNRIFLTWLPFSSRSQTLALNFKAKPIYFSYLAGGKSLLRVGSRYLIMVLHTVFLILFRRPRLVFVMNQPVFLPLTVYLLSRFMRMKYVVDSHSGLFNKAQWSWSLPWMKTVYRKSLFSIVTNLEHRQLVESWGTRVEVLGALTVGEEPSVQFNRPKERCFVVIGTFADDEPIDEMISACSKLPEARFYITGAVKKAPQDLIAIAPGNVTFTDFQPRPNYVGLVKAMDAAIILVKYDNVMQRGAYEAMSWGVPIITSDWPILKESFYRGTIFVDNTPEGIATAIREIIDKSEFYKREIEALRLERQQNWDKNISRINRFIEGNL
ncbi:MAG: glycosyltransferase [bacterium]|nr:glycosyltransferase [bacterium]